MLPAVSPANETERLAALHSYEVLDSQCEAALDNIVAFAAKLTGSPIALVSLIDAERQWFKARHGLEATETPRTVSFCAHAILNSNEMLVVPDATRDARFADNPLVTGAPDIRFYAGMPLVNPQGFALGTLCVIDIVPRAITADQRESLVRLAEMVTTTLELRRAMIQLRDLALTDPLTKLPNRAAFIVTLDRSIAYQKRHGGSFSLLYLDLDGFKQVNDMHGHAAGDQALQATATVLNTCVRREDVAARLGGDEFAVLLIGGSNIVAASERIRSEIKGCMNAAGWAVTASVGVITFRTPPNNVATALSAADKLMYGAKAVGKNQVLHGEYGGDHIISSVIRTL